MAACFLLVMYRGWEWWERLRAPRRKGIFRGLICLRPSLSPPLGSRLYLMNRVRAEPKTTVPICVQPMAHLRCDLVAALLTRFLQIRNRCLLDKCVLQTRALFCKLGRERAEH